MPTSPTTRTAFHQPVRRLAAPMGFHNNFDHQERRQRSTCVGTISNGDLEQWVLEIVQQGAQAYACLIDGTHGRLVMEPRGYQRVARLVRSLASDWRFGPIAVVVGDEQTHAGVHTLGLMTQTTCPVRAFWSVPEAEAWLQSRTPLPATPGASTG